MDSCWEDKPHLYKVYLRSGGLFDRTPEYKKERVFWRKPLREIAETLDHLQASSEPKPEEVRLLELALDTLIVLVDPAWWREHSPQELTRSEDRRLLWLLGDDTYPLSRDSTPRRLIAPGHETDLSSLEGIVIAATEAFVRARDAEGLEGCARLRRAILWEGEGAAVN